MTPEEKRRFDESNERWEHKQELKVQRRELIDRVHEETMRGVILTLDSGRVITLDGHDRAVLRFLRELDPLDRMALLGITPEDATRYVAKDYDKRRRKAKTYLLGVCVWKETGDLYDFEDEEINLDLFGIALKRKKLLSAVMRGKLPVEVLDKIIGAFEAQNNPLRLIE